MTTKRKGRLAFTDDGPTTSKAICHDCLDLRGITSYTVPYIMKDGRPDKAYRSCPYCSAIIPVKLTRTESTTEPLGSLSGKSATFEVATKRRSRTRNNTGLEPTEEPVPLLNNKPDTELESLLKEHNAILVSYSDENTDMGDEEY